MTLEVTIDRQGRVIIPLRERERLGLTGGEILDLVPTEEGVLLERRNRSEIRYGADGLPVVWIEGGKTISNEESLEAIHRHRERR